MKTITEMIAKRISNGMTIEQARSNVCQEIIINKLSKSPFSDKTLIKGGVVMFNMTKNIRRSTVDLDFDFIRYDISDESIKLFVDLLNKYDSEYILSIKSIKELKQDDYRGKRVVITIQDKTESLPFKLDIGIHTLLSIEQQAFCFSFDDSKSFLKINPPEQIVSEKLYSLAKHSRFSTRFKDVYDIYYLIKNAKLKNDVVRECLKLLTMKGIHGLHSIEDICSSVSDTLNDKNFSKNASSSPDKWLDDDYIVIKETIISYIYSI